jgi:hypothetical protein
MHLSVVSLRILCLLAHLPLWSRVQIHVYYYIIAIICPALPRFAGWAPAQPMAHKFFNFGPMVNFPDISRLRRETVPEAISAAFRTVPEGTLVSVDLTPRPAAIPDRSFGGSHLPTSL